MSIKPTDFFINVTDFFSVLLPGALVVYFLKGGVLNKLLSAEGIFLIPETELQGWLLFLLATYIAGHIIFLLGSLLMDNLVYNKFLRNTLFNKNFDLTYHAATSKRNEFIPTDAIIQQARNNHKIMEEEYLSLKKNKRREILNTYKWILHYFTLYQPEVLMEVKKLEADSKFFRSLVVAFLFIGVVLIFHASGYAILFFVLILLSVYRYGDLRYKSNQMAYELIVSKFYDKKLKEAPHVLRINKTIDSFCLNKNKISPYKDMIGRIMAGFSKEATLISVDKDRVMKSQSAETATEFYCIEGRGVLNISESKRTNKTILIPGAIINIPPRATFEISGQNREPLLLISAG